MSRPRLMLAAVLAGATMATTAVAAEPTLILESRLRHETVDQAGFANDASALTLRTRLGFETADRKSVV